MGVREGFFSRWGGQTPMSEVALPAKIYHRGNGDAEDKECLRKTIGDLVL
jgi:hypothetical protein